jgi:oligosaccharyltransferase complex subunit delta (ribophorin II)
VERKPLSAPVTLGASDSLKIVLTIQDGKTAKRPHQAFLLLKDADTGLDISYPFNVKENGKAKVDLVSPLHYLSRYFTNDGKAHKDLPIQFLRSSKAIEASLVLGSFGSSQGYRDRMFPLSIATDPSIPLPASEKALRYGKLPEIHHIFKSDPRSPSIIFSLAFTGAVLATLPALFGLVSFWILLNSQV